MNTQRFVWLMFVIVLTSCSGGERQNIARSANAGFDSEDSLAYVDEVLAESNRETLSLLSDELAFETQEREVAIPSVAEAKRAGPFHVRMSGIGGSRSNIVGRVNWRDQVEVALRRDETTRGFVRLEGPASRFSITGGNLALRLGEGLVLGRPFGSFPSHRWRAPRSGLSIRPSLSTWSGHDGIAIQGHYSQFVAQAVLVGFDTSDEQTLWSAVHKKFGRGSIGGLFGMGRRLHSSSPGWGGEDRSVVVGHAAAGTQTVDGSAEFAHYFGGRSYFVARMTSRGRIRSAVSYYDAPTFSTTTHAALYRSPRDKTVRGVRADFSARSPLGTHTFSLQTSRVVSADEERRLRRLALGFSRGRRRGILWNAALVLSDARETTISSDPIIHTNGAGVESDARIRNDITLSMGDHVRHRVRVDYWPSIAAEDPGVLISVATDMEWGRLAVSGRVSSYSLRGGQRGFISRPGVGPFEFFSSVSGYGADLAGRLRVRISSTARVVGYYGRPSALRPARLYIGIEMH